MLMPSNTEIPDRATQAAIKVARQIGIGWIDPIILRHSEHISIRLFPSDVVARVLVAARPQAEDRLRLELAVARHLTEKTAPIVGPLTDVPAGPYFQDGFAMTLWRFVEHTAADPDNREHMASAAAALRQTHDALADFTGELPSLRMKIGECRALLEDRSALPALPVADRRFLVVVYARIVAALDVLPVKAVPIHGDAGTHNVLMTSAGARYTDFESVSAGPREWDIGFCPTSI
jgi:Ser/Thr protein kinase RdoA (MazF antagonist)